MKRLFADAAHAGMCLLVALYAAALCLLCIPMPAAAALLIAAAVFALLMLLARRMPQTAPAAPETADALPRGLFAAAAGFCFSVLLIYLAAYFPGGLSSDSIMQWHQQKLFEFSDWHPALHTLLIALCARIVPHPAFALAVQMLAYALSVGYACASLRRWRAPLALCALLCAYLSLSPAISNVMTFLWKDCAFAVSVLTLGVQILHIHFSRGAWLERRRNVFALAAVLCAASILRHNGLALTLPAIVWLLISFPRLYKRLLAAAAGFVLLFALVRGPLYDALDVKPKESLKTETIGVPMVVLSHIYAQSPDALGADAAALMDEFGPWETFRDHDRAGDWNDTKWYVANPALEDYTLGGIAAMAVRAAIQEPELAREALRGLFDMPLLPFGDAYWRLSPYVDADNWFGFSASGVPILQRILGAVCRLSAVPALSWLFWRPGLWLLLVMAACTLYARRRPLSALTLPAMLICYHLVTCAVLSSPTDFRFFLSAPMIAPLCIMGLIIRPHE